MRLRAALASMLAVFLLSASCMVSACEFSCALRALGAGCGHGASAAQTGARAGHPILSRACGMESSGFHAHAIGGAMLHASSCVHALCESQTQTSAIARNLSSATLVLAQQAGGVVVTRTLLLPDSSGRRGVSETPPLRTPLLASLQTPTRI